MIITQESLSPGIMSQELSDKEISNAFDKLKITPETACSIKVNSNNLENGIKTMILDSIDKLPRKKKRPDIDSIFDFLSKAAATNVDKDTLTDSISQLITQKVLVNKNNPNGYDSLHLSNCDQKEIEHTQETKSDKKMTILFKHLTPKTPKRHLNSQSNQKHPCYKMSNKFLNIQHNRKH